MSSANMRQLQQPFQVLEQALRRQAGIVAHHEVSQADPRRTASGRARRRKLREQRLRRRLRCVQRRCSPGCSPARYARSQHSPVASNTRCTRVISLLSESRVWRMKNSVVRQSASQAPSPTYTSVHCAAGTHGCARCRRHRASRTSGSGRNGVDQIAVVGRSPRVPVHAVVQPEGQQQRQQKQAAQREHGAQIAAMQLWIDGAAHVDFAAPAAGRS